MPRKRQAQACEDSIVAFLKRNFSGTAVSLKMGIGDDAAVFRPRGAQELWVVTTDLLLENIDFRRGWLTPAQVGHKSLAVNLSDLAAMGARPRFHTVTLGLPNDLGRSWMASFYRGMTLLGDRLGTVLIGGDLSKSPHGLLISISALGESLHRRLVYRSGAIPGDLLFVSGTLGPSAAGLRLLEVGKLRGESNPERLALHAHRQPEPRCEAGLWLAQSGMVSCMMDLSDGLSSDLPRLCAASGTGAEIYTEKLPVLARSTAWGCDPLALALNGGEDFELLFAVPEKHARSFRAKYPRRFPQVTQIGRLLQGSAVVCRPHAGGPSKPLPALGFDHFRPIP
ncbi:MAG TPA: thiamine-phosphate kinase [Acidobacteriota bacterium]|nr:thiamine-phosphate kinase [Acidobacteriota bacterium]